MQLRSHLTDATLAAALDRDDIGAGAVARRHAEECESCRTALARAKDQEAEVGRLFKNLDHDPPEIDAAEFVRRIASRGKISRGSVASGRLWPRNIARWTVAASLLTAGVAAAALAPNSPVRRLIRLVAVTSPVGHNGSPATLSENTVAQSRPRGVEILPHGRVEVLFRSNQSTGEVRVIAAATAQLSVEADGDGPTYTVGENTIIVNNRPADSISYIVAIPTLADTDAVYLRTASGVAYSNVGNHVVARRPVDAASEFRFPLRDLKR